LRRNIQGRDVRKSNNRTTELAATEYIQREERRVDDSQVKSYFRVVVSHSSRTQNGQHFVHADVGDLSQTLVDSSVVGGKQGSLNFGPSKKCQKVFFLVEKCLSKNAK